jgi:hypothetical protein
MNISHHFEKEECKGNMNAWTVNEFVKSIFIESLDKMIQEDFILMRCGFISFRELA